MTDEYMRGFDDAKDAIGKMIALATSGLAGFTLIADAGGDVQSAKSGEAVTTAMNMILEEIETITPAQVDG